MPTDVTQLLNAAESGDPGAAEELLPLVYDELRKLAAAKMAREQRDQTLQATALVHEAWLRIQGNADREWPGRQYFFAAAAEAMRRILIDQARRKAAQKRGENAEHEELIESRIELKVPADEFIAVNDAVDELSSEDKLAAQVVKLRYFVGMNNLEVAEALDISPRSVDREPRTFKWYLYTDETNKREAEQALRDKGLLPTPPS
jgi:RNA polymerase sigma factor (TIGR02999 family)